MHSLTGSVLFSCPNKSSLTRVMGTFSPCGQAEAVGDMVGVSLPTLCKEALQGLESREDMAGIKVSSAAMEG